MKYHAWKDEDGKWVTYDGDPIPKGVQIVYHYAKRKLDQTPVKGIPCIREDKPHVSQNAAIHRDQVKDFNKKCVRGTHYDQTGALVSTSSGAREREARRRGLSFN